MISVLLSMWVYLFEASLLLVMRLWTTCYWCISFNKLLSFSLRFDEESNGYMRHTLADLAWLHECRWINAVIVANHLLQELLWILVTTIQLGLKQELNSWACFQYFSVVDTELQQYILKIVSHTGILS
jgi:hypothetical protein